MKGRPSLTAAWVAAVRGRLARPTPPSGIGGAGPALARDLRVRIPVHRNRTTVGYLGGRTRFFDGLVLQAVRHPGTVVLVGAGYDDRSLRFRSPGVRFVEVDHPVTQRDKRARLDRLGIEASDVCFLEADLERDRLDEVLGFGAAGVAAGVIDAALPVTVVCEGVLPYLAPSTVERVLSSLERCGGTPLLLAADVPLRPRNLAGRWAVSFLRTTTALVGEPIRTILESEETLAGLLSRTGWRESARTTGRDIGMPFAVRDTLLLELVPR